MQVGKHRVKIAASGRAYQFQNRRRTLLIVDITEICGRALFYSRDEVMVVLGKGEQKMEGSPSKEGQPCFALYSPAEQNEGQQRRTEQR